MRIHTFGPEPYIPVKVLAPRGPVAATDESRASFSGNATLLKFYRYWDLMDTIKVHSYTRAAMGVIGRSAVGAWWTLRENDDYQGKHTARHRRVLNDFYHMRTRQWDNIKDFYSIAAKMFMGVQYLRYFGQAGYQIVRTEGGVPIGLDFLHGLVVPNVDHKGYFKAPAFVQYPTSDPTVKIEFNDPKDIVFITSPDWEGWPGGGSDIESLTDFPLPLDILLLTAAREYMKNRDKPEVIYELPSDINEEAMDAFVAQMAARYRGASNVGKSPIAVAGEVGVKELQRLPSDLPFQAARDDTKHEIEAVTGVSGAKLGDTSRMTNSNLRELRREFHEATMIPLFRMLELAFFEQVHVREFGWEDWQLKFNSPDFLNAVERATVHMRYKSIGVFNPNEIRHELGKQPRTDELGDLYQDQLDEMDEPENEPGSPPEGRPTEPDAPSQTGEPTLDDQDPPRGDQHDDEPRRLLSEVKAFKRFLLRRVGKDDTRKFRSDYLPDSVVALVYDQINGQDVDEIHSVFDELTKFIREEL